MVKQMTEKFIIGLVGAPFGVNGFLKVRSCSGEIDHLLNLKSVIVSKDGKEQLLKIEETASALPAVLIRFAGINSPEAAREFTGAQLLAGRDQAAPLNEGEFYIEDLKGLPVVSLTGADGKNGDTLGIITDIIEGGGGELAEIQLSSGEKRLVPFRSEFFPEIDPQKGRVVLQNFWILE
ncbi:MAG: ribosome maturation factor RimM [Spirochaetes bacterium]|nr:ribosome maturation factor RimM [Spirochaetota bacterium]